MDTVLGKTAVEGVAITTGTMISLGPEEFEAIDLFAQVWFMGVTGAEISQVIAMLGVLAYFCKYVTGLLGSIAAGLKRAWRRYKNND